jgi:D-alanine transaminase
MSDTTNIVYLNGQYLPIEQASISVMDRGFLFGDGIYEVIPVFANRLLRVDDHLARLQNSLDRISLQNPHSDDDWQNIFTELLRRNSGEDRAIYLQVTRGVYAKRDISIKDGYPATVFGMIISLLRPDISSGSEAISAITVEDFRWQACDIKSTSLVANVMLRQLAVDAGVDDAILIRGGHVTEGTASNVFIVKDGVLVTPPVGHQLLSGITRDQVIEIAENATIKVEQREIPVDELYNADEIFMTSSTREIAPVIRLNGEAVGEGKPGPVWQYVMSEYQQLKSLLKQGVE